MVNPLVCLGDGHDGVWNLVKEFGQNQFSRCEILDWYHLKENLYKVGGSLKRLKTAETLLWQGRVEEAKTLFHNCRGKQAKNFIAYLEKHLSRIVNYSYYQAEQLCSIGSGAVESAIKQIGLRVKISGAQWNVENVNHILSVRCAYLKGATFKESYIDKAEIYTWLAWQNEPGRQIHQAIKYNILNPNNPKVQRFINWFKELYDL